jgi:hypothetical protein
MGLDGKHLLVQDTNHSDFAWLQPIKHDMLPMFVLVKPRTDFIACAADSWALRKGPETGIEALDIAAGLKCAPSTVGIPGNGAQIG